MDEYNLINSKTISDHCRKIGHKFNTEELAVLIYRNKTMSIDEKIIAYNELLNNYPDMEVEDCKYYDSVKDLIKCEINRIKTLVETYIGYDENSIYARVSYFQQTRQENNFAQCKRNYNDILLLIEKASKECRFPFKIIKKSLCDNKESIIAEYMVQDKKAILVNIYIEDEEFLEIDNIFINLPTPFKRGDILIGYCEKPFCTGILPNEKGIFVLDGKHDGNFTTLDMHNNKGYFIYDDGQIHNRPYAYDSFEYYKDELHGKYKVLKCISSFLQGKINFELFLTVYNQLKFENRETYLFYTPEKLELAGLTKDDVKRLKNEKNLEIGITNKCIYELNI